MNVSVVVRGPDFNAASGGETKYMFLARNMPHTLHYVDYIALLGVNDILIKIYFLGKRLHAKKVGNPGYRRPVLDTLDYEHTTS